MKHTANANSKSRCLADICNNIGCMIKILINIK